jgi:hypothetical protein
MSFQSCSHAHPPTPGSCLAHWLQSGGHSSGLFRAPRPRPRRLHAASPLRLVLWCHSQKGSWAEGIRQGVRAQFSPLSEPPVPHPSSAQQAATSLTCPHPHPQLPTSLSPMVASLHRHLHSACPAPTVWGPNGQIQSLQLRGDQGATIPPNLSNWLGVYTRTVQNHPMNQNLGIFKKKIFFFFSGTGG